MEEDSRNTSLETTLEEITRKLGNLERNVFGEKASLSPFAPTSTVTKQLLGRSPRLEGFEETSVSTTNLPAQELPKFSGSDFELWLK